MRIVYALSGAESDIECRIAERVMRGLCHRYDFELIAPRDSKLLEGLSDTRVKLTPMPLSCDGTGVMRDILIYRRCFQRNKPSILHLQGSRAARIAAALSGVRRLITVAPMGRKLGAWPSLYNNTTAMTISRSAATTSELILMGVPKEKIIDMPYGVDNVARTGDGCKNNRLLMSFLSDAAEPPVFLSAVARALGSARFETVVAVAEGVRECVLRYAALLGISAYVRVVGESEGREYYSRCRYFVYPSAPVERVPTPLLCAMSVGCAVIAPASRICREVVTDGECGLIYNAADSFALSESILRLISDEALAARLGAAARERWQKCFSTERMLCAYDSLYSSLFKEGGAKG